MIIMTFLQEEKRIEEEQTAKAQNSKIPVCYDDEDDYNSAITPNEPVDSLSMGDEHLNTIPATKSDEFIKSSVENLVPNPKEIIPIKIDPHHFNAESDLIESMLNHDSSIIPYSSKINSLLDEFAGELTLLKLISSGINKTNRDPEEEIRLIKRLLYDNSSRRTPIEFFSKNSNADIEFFSPSPIPVKDSDSRMEEIDLTFNPDDPMPPSIKDDDNDSERDTLILEELPSNHSLSLPENKSFHFDILSFSRPPAKPPHDNIDEYQNDGLLHLAGSQPMLKSSYKAKAGVIISIPPLVGGMADVVVEIKGTGCQKPGRLADKAGTFREESKFKKFNFEGWSISITFR
nr:hypothetical protein [Tanacetum cinerariifolium]